MTTCITSCNTHNAHDHSHSFWCITHNDVLHIRLHALHKHTQHSCNYFPCSIVTDMMKYFFKYTVQFTPCMHHHKKSNIFYASSLTKGCSNTTLPLGRGGSNTTLPLARGGSSTTLPLGRGGSSTTLSLARGGSSTTLPLARGGSSTTLPLARGGSSTTLPLARGGINLLKLN